MEQTTNYNLKKPEYTDFADIQDINDNMDTIDAQLAAPTGDSADSTTTFTTSDTADGSASSWTTVPALTSGETHKSLFAKMSQMFKNIRYLYKMLGTTDISSIGNGTVTGGLSSLNDSFKQLGTVSNHDYARAEGLTASATGNTLLNYPAGFTYNNCFIAGFKIVVASGSAAVSEFNDRIQLTMDVSGILVYVNHSTLYNKSISVFLIK